MERIYYFLIIVNILLAFKLWNDRRLHLDPNKKVNHPLSAAIDGGMYIISSWLLFGWGAIGWIVLAIGYRWLMFDLLFNLINHWEWNYYGSSSVLDKFLINLGEFHLLPKIILIIAGILIIML